MNQTEYIPEPRYVTRGAIDSAGALPAACVLSTVATKFSKPFVARLPYLSRALYRLYLGIADGMAIARGTDVPVTQNDRPRPRLPRSPYLSLAWIGSDTISPVATVRWSCAADIDASCEPASDAINDDGRVDSSSSPVSSAPLGTSCEDLRYIGSISASPTGCPLRGYGRAATQNDRLAEAIILSAGTSIPAQ